MNPNEETLAGKQPISKVIHKKSRGHHVVAYDGINLLLFLTRKVLEVIQIVEYREKLIMELPMPTLAYGVTSDAMNRIYVWDCAGIRMWQLKSLLKDIIFTSNSLQDSALAGQQSMLQEEQKQGGTYVVSFVIEEKSKRENTIKRVAAVNEVDPNTQREVILFYCFNIDGTVTRYTVNSAVQIDSAQIEFKQKIYHFVHQPSLKHDVPTFLVKLNSKRYPSILTNSQLAEAFRKGNFEDRIALENGYYLQDEVLDKQYEQIDWRDRAVVVSLENFINEFQIVCPSVGDYFLQMVSKVSLPVAIKIDCLCLSRCMHLGVCNSQKVSVVHLPTMETLGRNVKQKPQANVLLSTILWVEDAMVIFANDTQNEKTKIYVTKFRLNEQNASVTSHSISRPLIF